MWDEPVVPCNHLAIVIHSLLLCRMLVRKRNVLFENYFRSLVHLVWFWEGAMVLNLRINQSQKTSPWTQDGRKKKEKCCSKTVSKIACIRINETRISVNFFEFSFPLCWCRSFNQERDFRELNYCSFLIFFFKADISSLYYWG